MRLLPLLFLAACPAAKPPPAAERPAAPMAKPPDAGARLPTLADAEPEEVASALLTAFAADADAGAALEARLTATGRALQKKLDHVERCEQADVSRELARQVAKNLEDKRAQRFPMELRRLERQVIDFEAFRFETFVATGVFPKRYFGYLDERWDTAEYEHRLKRVTKHAAAACNRWLESTGATFRVTEQELVVTFLAEGGAVLLREEQSAANRVHPVLGIGLDDIAKGFADLKPLVKLMDGECGTHLETVVATRGGEQVLARFFTFEEALAGTAVMWVWEKQIAETKLKAKGRAALSTRSREQQFVIASLVYNSGILFDEKTVDRIDRLDTGSYLFDVSERSRARQWPLPVLTPRESLRRLLGGVDYPVQGTSWSTVFHVLERYGAFVALSKFDDAFDAGGALR
jgi:hypothetical protein